MPGWVCIMAAGWPTATCRPLGRRTWGPGGDHHGWGMNPGTVTVPARQLYSDINNDSDRNNDSDSDRNNDSDNESDRDSDGDSDSDSSSGSDCRKCTQGVQNAA